ncbi:MAG: sigma 54-interacting transcriptional regulator [Desulfobacula sp.]|uniref:sigma 54-interacting transcriptional regulator n=1 Tax=Desulfobacula sp. TaxID=2593537 RepID=UPI0025C6A821|nr:sigma 54-interacting transcriptional regulator [Desulfobacula sp.]MCD4721389.1 sigma 54-interacting transcriptional regulator [Desulfobacula sp.]
MLAKDIKLSEILSQEPGTGFPLIGTQRMLMSGLPAMSRLMKQLLTLIGPDQLAGVLSRHGYQIGMTAALEMASHYDFDSPMEWLRSAKYIGSITGLIDSRIEIHHFNQKTNELKFSAIGKSSVEVECWKSIGVDIAQNPICYISTGALSGFASVVFGSEVLVKEIACQAQGHKHCFSEGRSASDWGLSSSQVRELWVQLKLNPFEQEIDLLKKKLKKTQKDLAIHKEKIHSLEARTSKIDKNNGIIYRSSSMNKLILLADKVAPTHSTVLIQGESGTGKEVIARYIHNQSSRSYHPFLAVNCAALPPKLLESELFGHVKGAFTGADSNHKGLLLEAGKGSFFLDEIGELPLELQSKFLRVLQEKEIRPVGGLKSLPIEARIIAATNRDLKSLVKEKMFREDLYYRLAVFPLTVKPLRERKEDILLLSRHSLEQLYPGHPGFSPAAIRIMEAYLWPGNVRELENCIEYAVILAGQDRIMPEHFPQSMSSQDPLTAISSDFPTFRELEKRYTKLVLKSTNQNKTRAAKVLGTSVTTLWRRLKEMGYQEA